MERQDPKPDNLIDCNLKQVHMRFFPFCHQHCRYMNKRNAESDGKRQLNEMWENQFLDI